MSSALLGAPHRAAAGRPPPSGPPLGMALRLLAGPALEDGPERFSAHTARLGRRPAGGSWMLEELESSGLRGRGGAWFPAARKWLEVVRASGQRVPVVVVNASEGEPLSSKDRTVLEHRPHLILDGAQIAAESVGADLVLLYISRPDRRAARVLREALRERRRAGLRERRVEVLHTVHRYVAGESSAVMRRAGGGVAKPRFGQPHAAQVGVDGRPTLLHNAETIANVALLARFGSRWFRERGTPAAPGTALLTLSGEIRHPGVYEIAVGTRLTEVLSAAGGAVGPAAGALVGGYFGSWVGAPQMAGLALAPEAVSLGCGVVGVLAERSCPVSETARIATYLAAESAGQCGPCVFGLRAIADTMARIAAGDADAGALARLQRWTDMVDGRGGCRHPDGAVHNVRTALTAFAADFAAHAAGHPCGEPPRLSLAQPRRYRGWR